MGEDMRAVLRETLAEAKLQAIVNRLDVLRDTVLTEIEAIKADCLRIESQSERVERRKRELEEFERKLTKDGAGWSRTGLADKE